MKIQNLLQMTVLSLALVGCQTMDIADEKEPCAERDWFELGRTDGTKGEPNLKWERRANACREFSKTHHQTYLNGWYAGIDQFCSPEHGYLFGRTGLTYYKVCPASKEKQFMDSYQQGLQVFLYEKTNRQLNQEIREIEGAANKEARLEQLVSLLEKRTENQKQISRIEKQMNSRLQ